MIETIIDEIVLEIGAGEKYGLASGMGYQVHWCTIPNIFRRMVITIFQDRPMIRLSHDDYIDAYNQLLITVGCRAAEKSDEGLFSYETFIIFDDSNIQKYWGKSSTGDVIIR